MDIRISYGNFQMTLLALHESSRTGWLELAEPGGRFKENCSVNWYKRESRSLARTSALDFNKEGCVIQIWAD